MKSNKCEQSVPLGKNLKANDEVDEKLRKAIHEVYTNIEAPDSVREAIQKEVDRQTH